jgi:hypothetical protein
MNISEDIKSITKARRKLKKVKLNPKQKYSQISRKN